jgi:hypothetical protein
MTQAIENKRQRRIRIAALCCIGLCLFLVLATVGALANRPAQQEQSPAAPAQTTEPPPQQQPSHPAFRFAYGGNAAQIPAEFVDNLVFFPLRINDSKASMFELDTTAAATSIDPDRLASLGTAPFPAPVLNLNGVDFSLAGLPAVAKPDFAAQVGRPYQGTLGADFLCCVVVEIDYKRETVQLYDPSVYKYSGKGIPFTIRGGVPVIHTKFILMGTKSFEGDFAIDTALNATVVFTDRYAQSHGLFASKLKTIPNTDPQLNAGQGVVIGRMRAFELGPYYAENLLAAFSQKDVVPLADSKLAGTIGGGLLRRFTVIFDYPRQQIYIEANYRIREDEQEDKSGLTIIAKGPALKTFEVVGVQPGTPGHSAGFQNGDIIEGIDEDAAGDMTLDAVRQLFRQLGKQYKVLISRGGQDKQLTLKLHPLL